MSTPPKKPPYTFVVIGHELDRPLVSLCRDRHRVRIYSVVPDHYARIQYRTTLVHVVESLAKIIEQPNVDHSFFLDGGVEGSFGSVIWEAIKDEVRIVGDLDTRYKATLYGLVMIREVHAALTDFLKYY